MIKHRYKFPAILITYYIFLTTLVRCEPLVRVGSLVTALDRLGWTLPIVPEMEDLSLGGLVMGTGLETSSHRHGLFQNICRR